MMHDVSGRLHVSEFCPQFDGTRPSLTDGCGHSNASPYVGMCGWCIYQRLDEVDPREPSQ